jgi:hypothetical protein
MRDKRCCNVVVPEIPIYATLVAFAVGIACSGPPPSERKAAESAPVSGSRPAVESLAPAPKPACAAMAQPRVALTPYERCALRAYAARCAPADSCVIRCLASGNARNIGGGCWHVCYAYTDVPMTPPPPGQEACDAMADSAAVP